MLLQRAFDDCSAAVIEQTLEDEINRYKGLVDSYSQKMTDIDSNAAVNDKRVRVG